MGQGISKLGGAIGKRFLSGLEDYEIRNIESEFHRKPGNFGLKTAEEDFLRAQGVSDETLDEITRLFHLHGGNSAQQAIADPAIINHLRSNDEVGQALKTQILLEEALFDRWRQSHPDNYERVYRKGARKTGVEAWSINESGADMGYGGIGWDHSMDISALRRDGYHILAGMGRMLGAPGEGEITFVKW